VRSDKAAVWESVAMASRVSLWETMVMAKPVDPAEMHDDVKAKKLIKKITDKKLLKSQKREEVSSAAVRIAKGPTPNK
jgi:hypothetical protein